ncbi:uncharacterized protein [Aegilops tauschii subsp. strangulata]|uniref:uncharacterized protein n=1 Tax=Aegilops tauschii subsp. strangulata TaxID=200361 RepID=UPI003CC8AD03
MEGQIYSQLASKEAEAAKAAENPNFITEQRVHGVDGHHNGKKFPCPLRILPSITSSTFLLFPPPRHAHLGQGQGSGCRHRLCPGYKPRPLAGPLLLLLASPGPCLPPPRRALPGPLLLLFVQAVPLSSDLPAALRLVRCSSTLRPGRVGANHVGRGCHFQQAAEQKVVQIMWLLLDIEHLLLLLLDKVGYRQMSHLLFLALLRTLMGWVCLQRRTDNSIKNHWNISLRKKIDIYGTRNILAIPRLIALMTSSINKRRLLLRAILT